MKTGIITAAIAALTLLGTSLQSEARPRHSYSSGHVYISGYRPCGTPIYQQRYITRYKRCGTPVWSVRYVSSPRAHYYRPPVCPPPVRYCPPPPPVCPPTYYHGGYPSSGVVIQGSFGY